MIKSRIKRWAGHVAHIGERRNAYRALVGKLERKTPRGMPKSRWESNIKMNLKRDRMGGRGLTQCG